MIIVNTNTQYKDNVHPQNPHKGGHYTCSGLFLSQHTVIANIIEMECPASDGATSDGLRLLYVYIVYAAADLISNADGSKKKLSLESGAAQL